MMVRKKVVRSCLLKKRHKAVGAKAAQPTAKKKENQWKSEERAKRARESASGKPRRPRRLDLAPPSFDLSSAPSKDDERHGEEAKWVFPVDTTRDPQVARRRPSKLKLPAANAFAALQDDVQEGSAPRQGTIELAQPRILLGPPTFTLPSQRQP